MESLCCTTFRRGGRTPRHKNVPFSDHLIPEVIEQLTVNI
jgi:hypothetical protein